MRRESVAPPSAFKRAAYAVHCALGMTVMTFAPGRQWRLGALIVGLCVAACGANGGATSSGGTSGDGARGGDGPGGAGDDGGASGNVEGGITPADGPPQITSLAYYASPSGPRMLFRGTAPGDDLLSFHVEFLDAAGQPALVDLNGDGAPDGSVLDIMATESARGGAFFSEIQSAAGFDKTVAQIAAAPRASTGFLGDRKTTSLSSPPVRALGDGCDPEFDACASALVCAPGVDAAPNHCARASDERASRCLVAGKIDPANGPARVVLKAEGASLWEPQTDCVSPSAHARPEGLVWLHVATMTPSLTLTTALPETDFDTVLYVVPGCTADTSKELACNDDEPAPTSKVTLTNVAPGDYLVVVDSVGRLGGTFGLEVSAP